jgi:hypothetical protein
MRFVAAGCFAWVALAACSDTPISPNALRSQAAHFDSLATVESKKAVSGDLRLANLQFIANALAHGAVPATVTMTIANTPVTVHMVGIEAISPGARLDGNVYAAGWVDHDADTSIFVFAQELTTGFIDQGVALAIGDSAESTPSYPPQFTYSQQNTGAPCTNYPIVNQLAGPAPECHLALATISFTAVPATFEGSPQLLPVGAAIVSPLVTFGLAQLAGNGY